MIRGALRLLLRCAVAGFLPRAELPQRKRGNQSRCPGLGTFTVNFTGPVPFGPGVNIFGGVNSPVPPFTVFGVDQHMRTPYVQSYNFNVQQTLVEGTVFQVGYVGSKGTKLYRVRDINQATAGPWMTCSSAGLSTPSIRSSPVSINWKVPPTRNYNALQTVLRRRLLQGPHAVRIACLVAFHRRRFERILLVHGRRFPAAEQFRYTRGKGGFQL